MLSGKDWANLINNSENKKDLIRLVCSYIQKDECSSFENMWTKNEVFH